MIEWVFPISAALVLYLLVIPALTLIASAWLRTRSYDDVHDWGGAPVWLALTLPVGLPLSVFVLDAFHQIDAHHAIEVCVTPHVDGGCAESVLLGLIVALPLLWRAMRLHNHAPRGERLALSDDGLTNLRVFVDPNSDAPVATRGLMKQWVAVRPDAMQRLDERQLTMALWHEQGHVLGRDPLRRWLAHMLVAVNPLGRLLSPYVARWELGREAWCDLYAANRGDRFALAEALVRVARLPASPNQCCSLLAGAHDALALRISLLVHDVLPALPRRRFLWVPAVLLVAIAAQFLTHEGLHELHISSEQLFLALWP